MIEEDLAKLNTMNINELKKLFLRYFNAHPTLKTKEAYILKLSYRINKRSWIPIIGWILCYGFFNNCVIAPYFHVDLVDWEQLLTSLGIMLGISGIRDIGINRRKKDDGDSKEV